MVALRKESVDRNVDPDADTLTDDVALRKESVDRNTSCTSIGRPKRVALRKESVDRNALRRRSIRRYLGSLSARRAWIEIQIVHQ